MAFHAFHTPSFPWRALGTRPKCEVAKITVAGNTYSQGKAIPVVPYKA